MRLESIILPADRDPAVVEESVEEVLVGERKVFDARVCESEIFHAGPEVGGRRADEDAGVEELVGRACAVDG